MALLFPKHFFEKLKANTPNPTCHRLGLTMAADQSIHPSICTLICLFLLLLSLLLDWENGDGTMPIQNATCTMPGPINLSLHLVRAHARCVFGSSLDREPSWTSSLPPPTNERWMHGSSLLFLVFALKLFIAFMTLVVFLLSQHANRKVENQTIILKIRSSSWGSEPEFGTVLGFSLWIHFRRWLNRSYKKVLLNLLKFLELYDFGNPNTKFTTI